MNRFISIALLAAMPVACSEDQRVATVVTDGSASETPPPLQPPLPDTLSLPFLPLDAFLRPPPDSGRFNTVGVISHVNTCPPCPPDAVCEPCSPFGVTLRARTPNGQVDGVMVTLDTSQDTMLVHAGHPDLWVGHPYMVSVEVRVWEDAQHSHSPPGEYPIRIIALHGLGITSVDREAFRSYLP